MTRMRNEEWEITLSSNGEQVEILYNGKSKYWGRLNDYIQFCKLNKKFINKLKELYVK